MLVLRAARDARDEVRERVALQEGVGVDRDHERRVIARERRVQRPVLARLGLEDPPVVQAQALAASPASSAVRSVESLSARTT